MFNRLLTYLENAEKPVSSVELARHVFKLENVSPDMAEKLVKTALSETDQVVRHSDGMWRISKKSRTQPANINDIVLCQVVPERVTDWRQIAVLYCTRLYEQHNNVIRLLEAGNKDDASIEASARAFLSFTGNVPLLFNGFGNQLSSCRRFLLETVGHDFANPVFQLSRIVKRLFPGKSVRSVQDCANLLGCGNYSDAEPDVQFNAFVEQAKSAFHRLEQNGIKTVDAFIDWYSPGLHAVEFYSFRFDKEFIDTLPETPGVYIMKDRQKKIIYVGKSRQLRRRVSSYFAAVENPDAKLKKLREQLYDLEIILTGSELEALLLEQELIEKYQPDMNTQQKTAHRLKRQQQRYPRILVLPSVQKAAQIYCLKNGRIAACAIDHAHERKCHIMLNRVFFSNDEHFDQDWREEIITSWLTQHADEVRSIDMRLVSDIKDAKRLVQNHIHSLHAESQNVMHV